MSGPLMRSAIAAMPVPGRLAPAHVWDGSDQGLPIAGGRCTVADCGHACAWDRGMSWYATDVTIATDWGDVDGEGPCRCEHHELAGASYRDVWCGVAIDGLPWGSTVVAS